MKTFVLLALLLPTAALAETRTVYGPNGQLAGRTWSNNNGVTIFYDANGKLTGRMQNFGTSTTVYDAGGNVLGSVQTHGRIK